ncbi:hypothetical protein BJ944DRAFT_234935 [Cunninghamella echinulata]|nr:hypothetical protein BJ944DRAFT_234935 [Cunninghamella echinulata]
MIQSVYAVPTEPLACEATAKSDLDGRDIPSNNAKRTTDVYKNGDCIKIQCQVSGETINGSPVWDFDGKYYLPDVYIKTGVEGFSSKYPRCKTNDGVYHTGDNKDIVTKAESQKGQVYSWGGGDNEGPTFGICCSPSGYDDRNTKGFDCSGLTKYAIYQIKKISLVHYTCHQFNDGRGTKIPFEKAQPGDLIFYGTDEDKCNAHVAIYANENEMIEAKDHSVPVGRHPIRHENRSPYVVRF